MYGFCAVNFHLRQNLIVLFSVARQKIGCFCAFNRRSLLIVEFYSVKYCLNIQIMCCLLSSDILKVSMFV